jgi:D-alanine-D-alanine ligase
VGEAVKIAVLMGGTSAEREVSLASGRGICEALRGRGHEVAAIDAASGEVIDVQGSQGGPGRSIGREPPEPGHLARLATSQLAQRLHELKESGAADIVFVALHGGAGEDGRIQALLELVGIPYTGSGPLGSALAMDKLVSKDLFLSGGVPTPAWVVGPAGAWELESALGGLPWIVKPSHEGSTVGVSVVHTRAELQPALERAASFSGPPLIETFIRGRELAVGVLGDEALPIVEICPRHEIYDYECKYTKGMSEYHVPAPLSPEITEEVQLLAVKAHCVLRLSAYSRVDLLLDESGRPWCLEVNSLPGMTATSLLPKAAAVVGITYGELCERIVQLGLARASAAGAAAGEAARGAGGRGDPVGRA